MKEQQPAMESLACHEAMLKKQRTTSPQIFFLKKLRTVASVFDGRPSNLHSIDLSNPRGAEYGDMWSLSIEKKSYELHTERGVCVSSEALVAANPC